MIGAPLLSLHDLRAAYGAAQVLHGVNLEVRAGEAVSSVLLTATNIGLATCLLTEPLEVAGQRDLIRRRLLGDGSYPQAFVRVGWAPTSADEVPPTPRRAVRELLLDAESGAATERFRP